MQGEMYIDVESVHSTNVEPGTALCAIMYMLHLSERA